MPYHATLCHATPCHSLNPSWTLRRVHGEERRSSTSTPTHTEARADKVRQLAIQKQEAQGSAVSDSPSRTRRLGLAASDSPPQTHCLTAPLMRRASPRGNDPAETLSLHHTNSDHVANAPTAACTFKSQAIPPRVVQRRSKGRVKQSKAKQRQEEEQRRKAKKEHKPNSPNIT